MYCLFCIVLCTVCV